LEPKDVFSHVLVYIVGVARRAIFKCLVKLFKEAEMYYKKISPRIKCLHSVASVLFLRRSADFHHSSFNPTFALIFSFFAILIIFFGNGIFLTNMNFFIFQDNFIQEFSISCKLSFQGDGYTNYIISNAYRYY